MAGAVKIKHAEPQGRIRGPSTVALFGVATLGLYSTICYYKLNCEMRDFGTRQGDRRLASTRPWVSVLALIFGGVIVVPRLVTLLRTGRRVQAVERIATGKARPAIGLNAALLAAALFPLGIWIRGIGQLFAVGAFLALVASTTDIQARLNAAWRAARAVDDHPHRTIMRKPAAMPRASVTDVQPSESKARDHSVQQLLEQVDQQRKDRIERENAWRSGGSR